MLRADASLTSITFVDHEKCLKIGKNIHLAQCISSPILENEPVEICSHLSGKGPKGRFLRRPVGPKITRTKEMREGVCVLAYGR